MQFTRFFDIPVLKSSTYSEMVIRPDCTVKAHAAIVAGLKTDGFDERFSAANAALHTAICHLHRLLRNQADADAVLALRQCRQAALQRHVAEISFKLTQNSAYVFDFL